MVAYILFSNTIPPQLANILFFLLPLLAGCREGNLLQYRRSLNGFFLQEYCETGVLFNIGDHRLFFPHCIVAVAESPCGILVDFYRGPTRTVNSTVFFLLLLFVGGIFCNILGLRIGFFLASASTSACQSSLFLLHCCRVAWYKCIAILEVTAWSFL